MKTWENPGIEIFNDNVPMWKYHTTQNCEGAMKFTITTNEMWTKCFNKLEYFKLALNSLN